MSRECERLWEVDALREGRLAARDIESFARHRPTCEACRSRFEEDERLGALGRALPSSEVDPLHARRLRQSILRAAATPEEPSRSRWSGVWGSTAVRVLCIGVAIFALFIGWRLHLRSAAISSNAPNAPIEIIDPEAGAVWETRTDGPVERVKLTAGALTLTVRHREAGERFIVDLPDGEIEVRGTRFRVDVLGASTRSVQVREGLVALRRTGAREVLIAAGESWPSIEVAHDSEAIADAASTATAPSIPASHSPKSAANARSAPPASPAPSAPLDDDSEYEAAVNLFSAHRYDEAARALHAYAAAHPDPAFADDAAFLEASALARAGRGDAASLVAERFLDRYPASLHAPDAATLVVRAARDRHDCARARLAVKWITEPIARAAALGVCVDPTLQ